MTRALLLTGGGYSHPPEDSVPSLSSLFHGLGIELEAVEDVEAGLASLSPSHHDLLVVNALRFTMAPDRYDELRAEHAFHLSEAGRAAIAGWHDGGHPILALHTAVICFDDWRRWAELLGARWDWERSHHPPLGPLTVRTGDDEFDVIDECYQQLELRPGNDIVAASADGHPLAWVRRDDGGPVAVDLLGHDRRSLDAPGHRRLLGDLLQRLLQPHHPLTRSS